MSSKIQTNKKTKKRNSSSMKSYRDFLVGVKEERKAVNTSWSCMGENSSP